MVESNRKTDQTGRMRRPERPHYLYGDSFTSIRSLRKLLDHLFNFVIWISLDLVLKYG